MNNKLFVLLVISVISVGLFVQAAFAKPTTRALAECKDGIDNDGDGLSDLNDPGCSSKNDKSELDSSVECDDGLDNDEDGNVDYNDSGCTGPTDTDESDCGDGICEGGETSGNCPADCGYSDSCSDTDGGNVIATFGTTSGYLDSTPFSSDDYCVDSGTIMEYYCSGNYEQSQQQSCGTDSYGSSYCSSNEVYQDYTDYFCASGTCDSSATPVFQEDCDDSDGYGSNYCNGDSVMKNYYDYFCAAGACNYTITPESVVNCDIYDYYGSNYCYNDDVYRNYNDYYCSIGSCNMSSIPELVETCDYGCTNGECDVILDSCSDTDGGFVLTTQGTASGYLSENPYNYTDYCANNMTLVEFYCSGNLAYNYSTSCYTNTTTMCYNGACV
ncbi:MAG: hypothetical protein JW700_02895 [Candidatus Aenigmarchaeota archaeon]|nr:hypothetical protein [Candidatus Aenigmarchaeota archaeon]